MKFFYKKIVELRTRFLQLSKYQMFVDAEL